MSNKKNLRDKILHKRINKSKKYILRESNFIINQFINTSLFKNANHIMSYASTKNEVCTKYLNKFIIDENKYLYLPKLEKNIIKIIKVDNFKSMNKNKYGILEPSCSNYTFYNNLDLIIIPGIAFDLDGNRIGFGKGYYDRFLQDKGPFKVSFAYDFQVSNDVIISDHFDKKIDILVTKRRIYDFRSNV